ncbi:hypothetical protein GCM10027091_77420 [Streptomyces daliensis]
MPLGAEAAFGEDHDEGRVAEHLCQFGVAEVDSEAVLPYGDADAQVDEQAGQAAARGEAYGDDGDEEDQGAEEQQFVETVDSQGRILSSGALASLLRRSAAVPVGRVARRLAALWRAGFAGVWSAVSLTIPF